MVVDVFGWIWGKIGRQDRPRTFQMFEMPKWLSKKLDDNCIKILLLEIIWRFIKVPQKLLYPIVSAQPTVQKHTSWHLAHLSIIDDDYIEFRISSIENLTKRNGFLTALHTPQYIFQDSKTLKVS